MTESEKSNQGTINREGFLLGYRIEGEGTPAIIVGSVNQYPQLFSQQLRKHLKLVFIDHRAYVNPPDGAENAVFELNTILEDIEAIRQSLDLGKVIIIGHSAHSFMAIEYAKKYPQYVSHVVMMAMSPALSKSYQDAAAFNWQDFASDERKAAYDNYQKKYSPEVIAALNPRDRFISDFLRITAKAWYDFNTNGEFIWDNVPVNIAVFNHLWKNHFHHIDITEGLKDFNIPVFLVLGVYDFAIAPIAYWYPIRDKFQNLTLSIFEKSAHFPQYEEAQLFDERLLGWLKKQC